MINLQDFLTGIGFTAKYPYTDIHELNLDWCLAQIATLRVEFDDFAHVNSLKYAGEWDITKAYSAFSVVDDQGFGYMALKPVPPGTQITDTEYWLMVVDYSQILNDVESRITDLETVVGDASSGLVKDVDDLQNDMSTAQSDITALQNTVGDASSGLVKDVDDLQNDMTTVQGDITTINLDLVDIHNDINDLDAKINAATVIYPVLADLIADTEIVAGKYVRTLARSTDGDNGGAYYEITDTAPSGYYETLASGLFAKPLDAHNVLVFGVVGSGDETAKIQAAITEIADYVEFNAVTYTISDGLVFTQDIHGNNAKIYATGDIASALIETSGSVYDLEVYSDSSSLVRVGIYVTGLNSHVEDCYVHDLYNDDVSTPNHSVFGILSLNNSKKGCVVFKRNRVNNIVGTYIVSQTVYSAAGIVFNGESSFLIEDNDVSNIIDQYNGDCFSAITRYDDGTVVGIIRNNRATGGQCDAFKVTSNNAIIENNTIRFNGVNPRTSIAYRGTYGIRFLADDNKVCNNNIIDDTSSAGDYVVGIFGDKTALGGGALISGNNIVGCRVQIMTGNFNGIRITDNILYSTRSDTTMITNSNLNPIISGNDIDGHDIDESTVGTVYSGNNIKNCSIMINVYTSKHVITGNYFENSVIVLSADDIVNGNQFKDCPVPLSFSTGSNNIITCNRYSGTSVAPTVPAGNVDANNI